MSLQENKLNCFLIDAGIPITGTEYSSENTIVRILVGIFIHIILLFSDKFGFDNRSESDELWSFWVLNE